MATLMFILQGFTNIPLTDVDPAKGSNIIKLTIVYSPRKCIQRSRIDILYQRLTVRRSKQDTGNKFIRVVMNGTVEDITNLV